MPRPVLIVCAQSVAQDATTNLLSIFNVVEKVVLAPQETDIARRTPLPQSMTAVAIWMKDERDAGVQLEHQFQFIIPPDGREVLTPIHPYQFDDHKHLGRFICHLNGLPIEGPGLARIINRIRIAGEGNEWISQEYPILAVAEDKLS